jgi:hypothetical protein
MPREPGDRRRFSAPTALVARPMPVPTASEVCGNGLLRVKHEEPGLVGDRVHGRRPRNRPPMVCSHATSPRAEASVETRPPGSKACIPVYRRDRRTSHRTTGVSRRDLLATRRLADLRGFFVGFAGVTKGNNICWTVRATAAPCELVEMLSSSSGMGFSSRALWDLT